MREAHPEYGAEENLQPVVRDKGAVFHHIADRHLHPAVIGHDPEGRERGAERHHRRRKQIEPRWHTSTAKQQDSEKARLKEKGGEGLVGEERPLNRSGHAGEHAQLVPNWNAMTIPETTPSPNATPKTLSQNSNTSR